MSAIAEATESEVRDAAKDVIDRVFDFDDEARQRIFRTAITFYGLDSLLGDRPIVRQPVQSSAQAHSAHGGRETSFSERAEISPKDFLYQKQPQTDVDRVACLAYYLMHYRNTRHFKTIDISLLNTEAAQVKFSNAAYAVANAANAGLLVPAGKGAKQLSAQGERYVEALPDRSAAKEVLASMRGRRGRKPAKNGNERDD
jgi:hypothetical protein